ncbi:MAG: hypothetical protein AAFQ07_03620 [Chloroflexota bacterium]
MSVLAGDHIIVKLDDNGGTLRTFADGDIISVNVPLTYKQHMVAGFGDEAEKYINGQLQSPVTIKGYLTTTADIGTHTVIESAFANGAQVTLEVEVGNNATPTSGDPVFSGEYIIESYKPTLETGSAIQFEAMLKPAVGSGAGVPNWDLIA